MLNEHRAPAMPTTTTAPTHRLQALAELLLEELTGGGHALTPDRQALALSLDRLILELEAAAAPAQGVA
jgi:hypothetical protein